MSEMMAYLRDFNTTTALIRLLLALFLGGAIGFSVANAAALQDFAPMFSSVLARR